MTRITLLAWLLLANIAIAVALSPQAYAEPNEPVVKQWPGDYPKTMQAFEYAREHSPDILGYIDIGLMRYYAELYSMEVLDATGPSTEQQRRAALEAGIRYALEEKARDERINAEYAALQARVTDLSNQLRESQSRVVSMAYALNAVKSGNRVVATDFLRYKKTPWPSDLVQGQQPHPQPLSREAKAQIQIADELGRLRKQQQEQHNAEMMQRSGESMRREMEAWDQQRNDR